MSGLSFARPELWPLLVLLPLLWLLIYRLHAGRRRAMARYGAHCGEGPVRAWARATRIAAIAALFVLSWMEPRLGLEKLKIERRGLDLVFCLDVSRSMLAADMEPNRLERARRDIVSVLPDLRGGDRVALLVFAGESRIVVPLTHDLDSFRQLLATVDTDTIRRGGTDLAAAIRKAHAVLDPDSNRSSKAIILLTDGEDLAGAGQTAAAEAGAAGIVLHAVGYGSTKGAKIALTQQDQQGFLRDERGNEVVSALDSDGLRRLATTGGGEFLRADVMVLPLKDLKTKRLDAMQKRGYDAGEEMVHQSRYQWVLLPGLLLLCWDMLMSAGRRRAVGGGNGRQR